MDHFRRKGIRKTEQSILMRFPATVGLRSGSYMLKVATTRTWERRKASIIIIVVVVITITIMTIIIMALTS